MKKTLLLLFVIMFSFSAFSKNADLFSFDEEKVKENFSELTTLENVLSAEKGLTLNDMENLYPELVSNINYNYQAASKPLTSLFSIDDMDWGAFAWGLCCWPVGVFTVILNDDKGSNSKISYLIGLGTSFIISGGAWSFWWGP